MINTDNVIIIIFFSLWPLVGVHFHGMAAGVSAHSGSLIDTVQVKSAIQCGVRCAAQMQCYRFNYVKDTKQCHMYDKDNVNELKVTGADKWYKLSSVNSLKGSN